MISPRPDHRAVYEIVAREVPEVTSGTVELRAVARRPGRRTKLAVTALIPDVDAVGVCVGFKGRHANGIAAALGGERLDILPWSDIPEQFVKLALAPGLVRRVELDLQHHQATAYVQADQLELARGKDGENQALASELTGWTVQLVAADAA